MYTSYLLINYVSACLCGFTVTGAFSPAKISLLEFVFFTLLLCILLYMSMIQESVYLRIFFRALSVGCD